GTSGKPPSCRHWLRLNTLSNRSDFLYPQQCSSHDLSRVHACRFGFKDSENLERCERNLPSPRLLYNPSCKESGGWNNQSPPHPTIGPFNFCDSFFRSVLTVFRIHGLQHRLIYLFCGSCLNVLAFSLRLLPRKLIDSPPTDKLLRRP